MYPEMLNEYMKFCDILYNFHKTNVIDLSDYHWFYPTSLLPLANLLNQNTDSSTYISPKNKNVARYIDTINEKNFLDLVNPTYFPVFYLPNDTKKLPDVKRRLESLHNNGADCGGRSAFSYLFVESITNIYEHSYFHNACVMAQRYPTKGFVEISIFDDGITIPKSLEKAGHIFEHDNDAITNAINGLSSKSDWERGTGLSSSTNLCLKGYHGKMLVISGNGAIYSGENGEKPYELGEKYALKGTLVSMRISYPMKKVDLYKYI